MRSLLPQRLLAATTLAAIAATPLAPAIGQAVVDTPTVIVPPEPPLSTARSIFARDRGVAVADRMLPAFTAQGTTIGSFDVFAGLAIGGLFTSNIYADNAHREGDFAVVVRPELTARTSAGPYQLTGFVRGDLRRYARHPSENTEEGLAGIEGRVAIGALSSIGVGASYASLVEPRFAADSPIDAAKPLEYTSATGFANLVIEGARTRAILRGDVSHLRFRDVRRFDGGLIDTNDRDRTRYQGQLRLERALSPALSFYGAATVNRIDYRITTCCGASRDSTGYGAYVGTNFEVSALMRGDVRVGYIRQDFDLANAKPISGFGTLGTLVYFPNRLWTLTARVESSVEDSGVPGSGAVLHRGGSLRADHELRRYLIASVEGGYFKDTYRGLPRRDSLPFAQVSATYLSRNHWNARAEYRYRSRDCTCTTAAADFDDHRLLLTLTFQN